jgi:hypothetical protein
MLPNPHYLDGIDGALQPYSLPEGASHRIHQISARLGG